MIGEVARDFGLYTKITGGQRIDLFGARVEQLPADLAAAGRRRLRVRPRLRQGAAHGEVLRRHHLVPLRRAGLGRPGDRRWSCATAGLRAPHKIKSAVSGLRPRVRRGARARTSASSPPRTAGTSTSAATAASGPATPTCSPRTSTTETLVRLHRPVPDVLHPHRRPAAAHRRLDRGAGRRPGPPAGGDRRRLARASRAELEAAMARHVARYADEWQATLEDPERLRRFVSFVNAPDTPDPSIAFATERDQRVPAAVGRCLRRAADEPGSRDERWTAVCPLDRLEPERGRRRAASTACRWRSSGPTTGTLHAIDNLDPFAGPHVLSRGIVGTRGDVPTVASPMHKQVYDLRTGACLDQPGVAVPDLPGAMPRRHGGGADGRADPGVALTERPAGRLHRRASPPTGAATSSPRCSSGGAPGSCWRRRCGSCRSPTTPSCGPRPRRCVDRPPDDRVRLHRHRGARLAGGGRGLGRRRGAARPRSAGSYLIARGAKARGAIRAAGLADQWSPESE